MLTIKEEFFKRLDRTYERAQESAKASISNKEAWKQQVIDLAIMRRLLNEAGLFLKGSEQRAQAGQAIAQEQAEADVDQAEDLAATKLMADNVGLFIKNDVGTVKAVLLSIDPLVFAEAWRRLPEENRRELAAGLPVE